MDILEYVNRSYLWSVKDSLYRQHGHDGKYLLRAA